MSMYLIQLPRYIYGNRALNQLTHIHSLQYYSLLLIDTNTKGICKLLQTTYQTHVNSFVYSITTYSLQLDTKWLVNCSLLPDTHRHYTALFTVLQLDPYLFQLLYLSCLVIQLLLLILDLWLQFMLCFLQGHHLQCTTYTVTCIQYQPYTL